VSKGYDRYIQSFTKARTIYRMVQMFGPCTAHELGKIIGKPTWWVEAALRVTQQHPQFFIEENIETGKLKPLYKANGEILEDEGRWKSVSASAR